MAQAKKTEEVADLNPRSVKFNVKATPLVREARAVLLRAIVGAKGREADLDGLVDTLDVLKDYLVARGKRDVAKRKSDAEQARKSAEMAQAMLDNQRMITAKHDVVQANKGLSAAKKKLKDLTERQSA